MTVLAPFFHEGGRLTADDTHYLVAPDSHLTPVGESEFARDRAFGFEASHLPTWVEEKTSGQIAASAVGSLSLDTIRKGGPTAVRDAVLRMPSGSVVVANAVEPEDMGVVALGCLMAEVEGPRRIMYRTAAALVAARAGIPARPLLSAAELVWQSEAPDEPVAATGGLVVVGSYVGKSTDQLARLLELCPWAVPVELRVADLAAGGDEWRHEEQRARLEVQRRLLAGESVVLHTSRTLVQDDGQGGLLIGQRVTDALCSIVRGLEVRPTWLVAKGGITSNDIAVEALGVKRALVMGAIVPGVPVWRYGMGVDEDGSWNPGSTYVVFPGNVGAPDDLARVVMKLTGRTDADVLAASGYATTPALAPTPAPPLETAPPVPLATPHPTLDMLREAREYERAVGAFNVYNLEGALAVVSAAEELGCPAILQVAAVWR